MSGMNLDPVEARVLGVLMEKEVTTPDAYPLSINAATSGCNQKSNRDPVTAYTEGQVRDALERLVTRTLVREAAGAGGRTRRFAHRMDSRLFGTLEFSREERAVLCVLLLRGPQTPGEIRSRTARLTPFEGLDEVESVLAALGTREDGPHVEALAREPGRREVRYRHLCSRESAGAPAPAAATAAPSSGVAPPAAPAPATAPTLAEIMRRLDDAEARIEALEAALGNGAGAPDAPEQGPPGD